MPSKKVGTSGRFKARYGATLRKRWKQTVEKQKDNRLRCPKCGTRGSTYRISVGIWHCKKCNAKFTGGAYNIETPRGAESFRVAKRKQRELEVTEEE